MESHSRMFYLHIFHTGKSDQRGDKSYRNPNWMKTHCFWNMGQAIEELMHNITFLHPSIVEVTPWVCCSPDGRTMREKRIQIFLPHLDAYYLNWPAQVSQLLEEIVFSITTFWTELRWIESLYFKVGIVWNIYVSFPRRLSVKNKQTDSFS